MAGRVVVTYVDECRGLRLSRVCLFLSKSDNESGQQRNKCLVMPVCMNCGRVGGKLTIHKDLL